MSEYTKTSFMMDDITAINEEGLEKDKKAQLLEEQKNLLEIIASGKSLDDCLSALCEAVSRLNSGVRASVLLADERCKEFKKPIAPDILPSFSEGLEGAPINDLAIGTCGTAVYSGSSIICEDIENDEKWSKGWRDLCVAHDVLACHSTPIFGKNGNVFGSFMLCFNEPRVSNEWEHRLAEFGTQIASIAIERDQTIQALRESEKNLKEMNKTLEERVEERTAKLLSYQEQLRSLANELSRTEEEERWRLATELHDNLAQMLAVCKIKLDLMEKTRSLSKLTEASDLLDDALDYTHELMTDLKPPPSIFKEDMGKAMAWLAKKMKKHNLDVTFTDSKQSKTSLDKDVQTTLIQSVRELLYNVVKHAGVDEARISLAYPDHNIRIIVEDKGAGFNVDSNEAILSKGRGFGLFNIRERIDLLGGSVDITSEPGEGTEISLLVPLEAGADTSGEQPKAEEYGHSKRQDKNKIKVLLVDDHEMMREGLREIIEAEDDLTVIAEAPDGKRAIKSARKAKPDVVIMDINLPDMNGIDATQKIKSELPEIHIIGLSFHKNPAVVDEMHEVGASAFLSKSDAFETLCATIRSEVAK